MLLDNRQLVAANHDAVVVLQLVKEVRGGGMGVMKGVGFTVLILSPSLLCWLTPPFPPPFPPPPLQVDDKSTTDAGTVLSGHALDGEKLHVDAAGGVTTNIIAGLAMGLAGKDGDGSVKLYRSVPLPPPLCEDQPPSVPSSLPPRPPPPLALSPLLLRPCRHPSS